MQLYEYICILLLDYLAYLVDNLFQYRVSGWFEVYQKQTAEISIINSNGGYSAYFIFASHNQSSDRSFAGIIFGSSDSWGYGIGYNQLISNTNIQITQGNTTKKELVIKNNSSSQYMINFLKLSKDNSELKFTIV